MGVKALPGVSRGTPHSPHIGPSNTFIHPFPYSTDRNTAPPACQALPLRTCILLGRGAECNTEALVSQTEGTTWVPDAQNTRGTQTQHLTQTLTAQVEAGKPPGLQAHAACRPGGSPGHREASAGSRTDGHSRSEVRAARGGRRPYFLEHDWGAWGQLSCSCAQLLLPGWKQGET